MEIFQYKELEALKQRLEQDLKTMKKFAREKTMLEQNKKMDKSQQGMEHLQETLETGRATLSMHTERCKIFEIIEERINDFIESAPKYSGNLEKVFGWFKNLETHLINYKWETVPDNDVKRMLHF